MPKDLNLVLRALKTGVRRESALEDLRIYSCGGGADAIAASQVLAYLIEESRRDPKSKAVNTIGNLGFYGRKNTIKRIVEAGAVVALLQISPANFTASYV